jgi:simple sugar transport system ATP-binding protein
VLTPDETDRLFEILRALKRDGVTILLITHKLREIMEVTDAVSVMRQGEIAGHRTPATTSREELAELMVGRKVRLDAAPVPARPGPVALMAEGLRWRDAGGALRLDGVGLELREGEILGVAGVTGNGQSELLDLLSGIAAPQAGRIRLGGRDIEAAHPAGPAEMRALGLAHVPEDRQHRGLVLNFSAAENVVLGYQGGERAGPGAFLGISAIRGLCQRLMQRFDVRPADPSLRAGGFSGGNQQKIVLAREIDVGPKVLLVGQPTRGVDIGAIEFINRQLADLKQAGCAILLVSVELDEILALSDRIMVMNAGRVVGTIDRAGADRHRLGMMMAGIAEGAAA